MRPVGFHPGQQIAQLCGGLAPACPVEGGVSEAPVARGSGGEALVLQREGDQVAQAAIEERVGHEPAPQPRGVLRVGAVPDLDAMLALPSLFGGHCSVHGTLLDTWPRRELVVCAQCAGEC